MKDPKQINGKYYHEYDVIMLPSRKIEQDFPEDEYRDYISLDTGKSPRSRSLISLMRQQHGMNKLNPQDLYLTSDEEIKEGDWYIHRNAPHQCKIGVPLGINPKIIATTNMELTIPLNIKNVGGSYETINLLFPFIPQSFINLFIEEYNKGNIIKKVMVEYDGFICKNGHEMAYKTTCVYPHCDHPNYPKLKINQDNTINIFIESKTSWTREEVESLLVDLASECLSSDGTIKGPADVAKWIKNHL